MFLDVFNVLYWTIFLGPAVPPELTKSLPLRHQRSYSASRTGSVSNKSEKMPMISPTVRPLPTNREYYMQIPPNQNHSDHHDYMQIGAFSKHTF